jgi:hypothetical protein
MKFDVKDEQEHQDFLTPHTLLQDKKRNIFWAAMLRPTGLAVYMAILNHTNYQSRKCHPSESLLAKETGLNLRQVKREIKKLKEFGFIAITTPDQKTDLFNIPEREKITNTYTILDKKEWRIPEDYQAPTPRTDKGKQRKQTQQLNILDGDSQSPGVVTHSHQGGDSQSPEVVTDSHQGGDSQSPGGGLSVPLNNPIEIIPGNNPINNNTHERSAPDEKNRVVVVDVVDHINVSLHQFQRTERITVAFLKQLCTLHHLKTPDEALKAVKVLVPNPSIQSVLAVLKGKRNGSEGYESSCFYDGVCLLASAEPEHDRAPTRAPDKPHRPATDLQARFNALTAQEHTRLRTLAERKLSAYKPHMNPDVYAETLEIAIFQEFTNTVKAE